MSHPDNIDPRLWHLVNAAFDGTISDQETRELEVLLDADPASRAFYIDFLTINNRIRWLVNAKRRGKNLLNTQLRPPERSVVLGFLGNATQGGISFINHYSPYSFVVLLVFFVAAITASVKIINLQHSDTIPAEPIFVAQITAERDCLWSDATDQPDEMAQLEVGRQLKLLKGLIEITYSNQAVVLLEGPASYTVDSPNSGFLGRGKLTATAAASQAKNFTITTPDAKFVDLGTEFGVMIDVRGRSIAAVFSGKIKAEAKSSKNKWSAPLLLRNDEAALCDATKMIRMVASRNDYPSLQFVPPMNPIYRRWMDVRQELRNRPDLTAYYDFQPDHSHPDVLINRANTGVTHDGIILGATWVDGRLPGKKALEFKKPGSGVHVNLPKEMGEATLIAWVNIGSLPNRLNSLIMSDGWKKSFATHWMLKDDGRMRIAVQKRQGNFFIGIGDTTKLRADSWIFPKESFNRWCMLTTVFDSESQQITHYFNGLQVEIQSINMHTAVVLGPAMIGSWDVTGETDDQNPERTLNGRMDELMIFASALSPEDIKKIYEAGKP